MLLLFRLSLFWVLYVDEEGEMGEDSGEKPMVLLPTEESISSLRNTPPLFLYKRIEEIGCATIANVAATKLRVWLQRLDGILFFRFAILFLDTRQIQNTPQDWCKFTAFEFHGFEFYSFYLRDEFEISILAFTTSATGFKHLL